MDRRTEARAAFLSPGEFWSSPLYQHLCPIIAVDPYLLDIAASARPGQVPSYALFGAVHACVLAGPASPLGEYYQSVCGDQYRRPDAMTGSTFLAFVRANEPTIRELLSTRLVQTNHVQRAVGLRLGLARIADRLTEPAHLLEIGCSAGLALRHALYGYELGGQRYGSVASPVQLRTEWRGGSPMADLDRIPVMASTTGIDLNPLDPGAESDRRWLEALVWPEDRAKAALLRSALAVAASEPVRILAGDAIELCPQWADEVPADAPRIVFHCATRMHVPVTRRAAFDRAIESAGVTGPLFRIAIEGDGLQISGPDGDLIDRYEVDGHLAWIAHD